MFRNFILALTLLAPSLAFAQATGNNVPPVQQSASRADAATFIQAQSNGATSCNTVSETAAQDTITIPAGPGYIYITQLYIHNSTDATGVTQTGTISTTNITGSPIWDFNSALTTVQGTAPPTVLSFNPPLKAATPGTAVTFVPSASQSAHNYLCMNATGYYAP